MKKTVILFMLITICAILGCSKVASPSEIHETTEPSTGNEEINKIVQSEASPDLLFLQDLFEKYYVAVFINSKPINLDSIIEQNDSTSIFVSMLEFECSIQKDIRAMMKDTYTDIDVNVNIIEFDIITTIEKIYDYKVYVHIDLTDSTENSQKSRLGLEYDIKLKEVDKIYKVIDIERLDIEYSDFAYEINKNMKISDGQIRLEILKNNNLITLRTFHEDLAAAQAQNGNYGFINRDGDWIIEPVYHEVGDFSEGIARVSVQNKWGFIDSTGIVIVEPHYQFANDFKNDLGYIGNNCEEYYVDHTGTIVLRSEDYEEYVFGGNFSEDNTTIIYTMTEEDGDRIHYASVIDNKGTLHIDGYKQNIAHIFEEVVNGYRIAESTTHDHQTEGDTGVIDNQGNWVIKPIYDDIKFYDDTTLIVTQIYSGSLESGLMTLQGGWIQKPNKMMIWDYGHGLLVYYTMTEPQKMELYDLQGNMLLQGKSYQSVKIIDEDLVLCKKDDSTPPKLFWSDGTSIMSEYYVEQGQIINDNIISTSIWINGEILIGILDKENPEQWIIAPRYERILFTNYDTVEGIVVNYEKSTNDTVTFHCETFDMQGNILSVSEEITLSYDAYKEFCS